MNDSAVPVENSMMFAEAIAEAEWRVNSAFLRGNLGALCG
jgi:hypothetical protein